MSVFFSYSHADEALRDQLEKQLSMLKRQGVIETWHDRRIGAGEEFEQEIDHHVEQDEIIILLVSPDFLASDYCYEREMRRAVERNQAGEAVVIPVILRACDWQGAPFGRLQAVPRDGKPVTLWPDRDQAFLEVAKAVRAAAERFASRPAAARESKPTPLRAPSVPATSESPPRSSNLRLAKSFSDRDKDRFRVDAFEYMSRYFENSLEELSRRNPSVEGSFRRIDANRFTASAYRDGKRVAECTVFMGGGFLGNTIAFVAKETTDSNSTNEQLMVEADDQSLFLKGWGMAMMGRAPGDQKLSMEGAAEVYWSVFIEPLQNR